MHQFGKYFYQNVLHMGKLLQNKNTEKFSKTWVTWGLDFSKFEVCKARLTTEPWNIQEAKGPWKSTRPDT